MPATTIARTAEAWTKGPTAGVTPACPALGLDEEAEGNGLIVRIQHKCIRQAGRDSTH